MIFDADERSFRCDAIVWKDQIVVGFGHRVFMVRPERAETRCVSLTSYFSSLHSGDDWLLVTSGQEVVRLDEDANVIWRRTTLGLDGVVINSVRDAIISGSGDCDPPGGWKAFKIALLDGNDA